MNCRLLAFFILFLTISIKSVSQQELDSLKYVKYTYPSGTISGEGWIRDGKPNGIWKNYYENGVLKSVGKLSMGLTDSTWKFFNEAGLQSLIINYSKGKKEGERILFSAEGKKMVIEHYENDVKSGWSASYHEDGYLLKRVYFSDGKESGRAAEFDENGQIINLFDYKNGVLVRQMRVNRRDKAGKKLGNWVETDSLYQVKLEVQYSSNMKNGFLKGYDSRGNLIRLEKYVDDVLQADALELKRVIIKKNYHSNGSIKRQGSFLNDSPVGLHTYFDSLGVPVRSEIYEKGILVARGRMDDQGRKQGEWEEYYLEGEIKSRGSYQDDLKHGAWLYFHKNGQVEQKGSYSNGLQEGKWQWFYEDSSILRIESFANGKEEGFSFELLPNGDTLSAGEYYRGQREGNWFFRDGDQTIFGQFDADEMNGTWIIKYSNGGKSFSGAFLAGKPEGKHQAWYDNGSLKWEGKYVNGIRQGNWSRYLIDGTPSLTIQYQDGIEKKYDGFNVFPDFAPADFESLFQKNPYIF